MGWLTKKTIQELAADIDVSSSGTTLKRTLNSFDLIFFGIGAIIGAGLFSITGIAAAENAGPAITISFLLAAIACGLTGLCYSELATMIPISGSAYTYVYASMGKFPAWAIGWTLILEYALGAATVAISWSAYTVSFLEDIGFYIPQWISQPPWQPEAEPGATGLFNLPAIFIVCALSILIIRGVKESAVFNLCIVIVKLIAVCLFIGFGAFFIDANNYVPFIPVNTGKFGEFGWSGILRASSVVFFAYIGFDAISTTALEAKDPRKSIPKGILGSLIICAIIYMLFALVLTGLVPYKELHVAAPVALAISKTPYPWLHWFIKLAVLAGLTSVILVFLMGQSRIFYAMAKDGLLPPVFAKLHARYFTPWISNLMLMVFVGSIAALCPLSVAGHMTSIGTLLAFSMVCVAVIILRYTHPDYPRPFKVAAFPLIPILGMMTCVGMMAFLAIESWIRLGVWMLIGLVVYFLQSRRKESFYDP